MPFCTLLPMEGSWGPDQTVTSKVTMAIVSINMLLGVLLTLHPFTFALLYSTFTLLANMSMCWPLLLVACLSFVTVCLHLHLIFIPSLLIFLQLHVTVLLSWVLALDEHTGGCGFCMSIALWPFLFWVPCAGPFPLACCKQIPWGPTFPVFAIGRIFQRQTTGL